jgi:hypothetical protein
MLQGSGPFYTYFFGSMGQTLETARQTEFFQWFHMEETERRPEEPGTLVRFRPSGEKFHNLCYLETLEAPSGEMVRMELVVQRPFIDGADGLSAQDLVKSFLLAALPDACKEVLRDFMREIIAPGGDGSTPGFQVFRGRLKDWSTQTGWTRLSLANLPLAEAPSFVLQVEPNPKAPNAKLVGEQGLQTPPKTRDKMKILLFGASGTAGGAVLEACLGTSAVEEVRVIVRRPLRRTDAKLREFVHTNYMDYSAVAEAFRDVDACFFCLGISVRQVSKEDYVKISHDYPFAAAKILKAECPGASFHYISGAGTKASSNMFWSKVKGQTENELMELVGANCWRPAYIDAKASPNLSKMVTLFHPLFLLLKPFRSMYVAGKDLGLAMLEATRENLRKRVIENAAIRDLAKRFGRS